MTQTLTTQGIRVSVKTQFQPSHSEPQHSCFVFAYQILIENTSGFTVQLLNRHWNIIDSLNEKKEVKGEGVVGVMPTIEPGEKYEYISGCNLRSEMGKMYGVYLFERKPDGKLFEVKIPEFQLIMPAKNN
ncbi:MAG: Co2+/Mg2+ efflux protein ApaG [Bacteroidetes bacterium RIFCSPLOWO2_02_FULL_36_8]|nr:MAG: Co2+/Mg2+ efflux protein ApaG [Bacteroidetes bacterium RIFCSPLOWO2_02_FULL_36_8]OFY71696.1 MAG: Co2+/Mg2+ efflux protein ApaG [Bacteroidetes bacterium RIFCSPLOWO2_12_FULL_37_12]